MKRRLFWTILIGFWLTFILITQGIWLAFSLARPDPEMSYMRSFARMSVAAASSAIRFGGEPAFEAERKTWPSDWRNRVQVKPAASPLNPRAPVFSETVNAPDGTLYRVSYYPQLNSRNHGFFGIPLEVVLSVVIGGLGFSAILAWYLTNPIRRMQIGFRTAGAGRLCHPAWPVDGAAAGRDRRSCP